MGTGERYERAGKGRLPFAGITLFRFNGYYLSLPLAAESTPRNVCRKNRHLDYSFTTVTLNPVVRST
jgi:hypothetical protein